MRMTEEQSAVVEKSLSSKSLVVNALAGSGKSATAIECVKANSRKERGIIYLSFNKSVAQSMKGKLDRMGIRGPEITTLHSLAYRRIGADMISSGRQLGSLKPFDAGPIVDGMARTSSGRQAAGGYLLNRFRKLAVDRMLAWCGSASASLEEFFDGPRPRELEDDIRDCGFNAGDIDDAARRLWEFHSENEKAVLPHDVYLKLFHLSCVRNPSQLGYGLAIVDEAQDLFPVTEAIVEIMRRNGTRLVFFGDRYQQIYSWNGSVNSMQHFEKGSDVLALTRSFRCPAPVVAEALKYLRLLGYRGGFVPAPAPCVLPYKAPILISRTNSSLLTNIHGCELPTGKIFMVGGIQSYNFDPVSDYVNFVSGHKDRIKSPAMAAIKSDREYDEYCDAAGDLEMKNAKTIVRTLGMKKICDILGSARKGGFAEKPEDADLCLSTGHKVKGGEFMRVRADPSFKNMADVCIREQKDAKGGKGGRKDDARRQALLREAGAPDDAVLYSSEELRLAYVTLTRSTDVLEPGPLWLSENDLDDLKARIRDRRIVLTDLDAQGNTCNAGITPA